MTVVHDRYMLSSKEFSFTAIDVTNGIALSTIVVLPPHTKAFAAAMGMPADRCYVAPMVLHFATSDESGDECSFLGGRCWSPFLQTFGGPYARFATWVYHPTEDELWQDMDAIIEIEIRGRAAKEIEQLRAESAGEARSDHSDIMLLRLLTLALCQVREDLKLSREHHDATLEELDAAREDAKNYAYNLDQFRAEADRVRAGAEAVLLGLASGADEAREDRDIYQAEVAALQEALEDRERYWDGVRRLMIEAGAEPGDAEHMARSLIDQRDAARWQVQELREALGVQVRVQGCTCGARPESPSTHPHVLGCPVEQALAAGEKEAK